MTSMDICVLQKNDELWCGQSNTQGINLLAAALKPETATVDEMFAAVKERKYPWGFSWKAGTKMMRKDAKPEDLDFHQIAGFPLKYASPSDVFAIASEGALIIDLQNKKLIHLDHRSPEGAPFPAVLGVWLSGDSVANKKFSECEKNMKAEGREKETWGPSNPCNKFILKTRPPGSWQARSRSITFPKENDTRRATRKQRKICLTICARAITNRASSSGH